MTDPLVYEVLFQRNVRRLEQKGVPVAEAEAVAREETLKSIDRIARQQVDLVERGRRIVEVPMPPPDDAGDEDRLSPGEVMQLLSDRQDGKANPEEVRRLLLTFCKYGPSDAIVDYLRQGVAAYLRGDHLTLDHALGLARRRGRPRADEYQRIRMALKVLRLRLAGKSFEVAIEETAEAFSCQVTTVSEAWAPYWPDAINTFFAERMLFGRDDPSGSLLTPEEVKRLKRIERSLVKSPAYSRHFAGVTRRSIRHK